MKKIQLSIILPSESERLQQQPRIHSFLLIRELITSKYHAKIIPILKKQPYWAFPQNQQVKKSIAWQNLAAIWVIDNQSVLQPGKNYPSFGFLLLPMIV